MLPFKKQKELLMQELIFVIDPMCSWCWGFHPTIEALRKNYADTYTFSLVMGGLRTTGQMQWNVQSKAYLKQNWDAVTRTTGQSFSQQLLKRSIFDYNTYPACKAVVTVRECFGTCAAFSYVAILQKAFYTQGKDITDIEVLTSYLPQDRQIFLDFYHSKRAELLMHHDFSKARSMGANSFPSTVKIDQDGHMICLSGYRDLAGILNI